MKPIKKFSTISDETTKILESLKANHDQKTLETIVQQLGFKSLEEISKQKNLLSKLESFLKEFPGNTKVDEDEAEEIEDEVVKRGEPKSLEDKEGEKEEDKEVGGSNEVAEEETETEEETEETETDTEETDTEETETEEEPKDSKTARRIMSFEDFIKEDETINKNVSYRDDEDEEDNAELDAASADPLAETETVDDSGLAIPPVTGDGMKTAEEIEDEKVKMGEPETLKDAEGETLVTKDQAVTEDPKTSKDEPANTVVEGKLNEEDIKSEDQFKEYATTLLKNAFGDDYDEAKATEVIDGLLSKYGEDFGAMVGALQSSLN